MEGPQRWGREPGVAEAVTGEDRGRLSQKAGGQRTGTGEAKTGQMGEDRMEPPQQMGERGRDKEEDKRHPWRPERAAEGRSGPGVGGPGGVPQRPFCQLLPPPPSEYLGPEQGENEGEKTHLDRFPTRLQESLKPPTKNKTKQ